MKRYLGSLVCAHCLLGAAVLLCPPVQAQSASQASRIAEPISDSQTVILEQSRAPLARPESDRGPAPSQLELHRVLLLLERSPQQSADLELFLRQIQDKNSPNYHRWLAPQAFGERFGPSDADLLAVTGWLRSEGFVIDSLATGRQWIEFSGSAAQVEAAFHAPIRRFTARNQFFYSNASALQIPAALAPVVAGIVSLGNPGSLVAHTEPILVADAASGKPIAHADGVSVSAVSRSLTPQDFAAIYNLKPLYAAGFDGSAESIAIIARSNLRLSDVMNFRQAFTLPANQPQVVLTGDDPGLNEDQAETILDTSWAGAIAPMASVTVIASGSTNATDGIDLSIAYAVDHAVAHVISTSYVSCETELTAVHAEFYRAAWQQAAAEGITVVVAAGDSGAAACEDPAMQSPVSTGYAVNAIASTPYNTAVGATAFFAATPAPASDAAKADSAYLPEAAWSEGRSGFHAGAGGASTIYVTPSWQQGISDQAQSSTRQQRRLLPDLSLAGAAHDAAFDGYYAFFQDAAPSRNGASNLVHYSGTSASAAAFAGMIALVDQYTQSPQGNANPHLYGLARMGGVFHDVQTGDQLLPCEFGTEGCSSSGTGLLGYPATQGYDLATGLGSVDAQQLAALWNAVPNVGSTSASLAVVPSSATPTYGAAFSATATLTYSGTTAPTGSVAFTIDGVSQGTAPLSTTAEVTTATLAIPTPAVGSHGLAASYAGDTNFAATATQSVTVVVSKGTSVISISASPAVLTAGVPETFTAVVTSGSTAAASAVFTGNVQFFDGTTPLGVPVALTTNQAVSSAITLDATLPHAITAVYYGDGNWMGSTSPQLTLKASAVGSTVSLQVSSPVVLAGSIVTFTATIAGSSANPGVIPTGTVIFFDGANPIGQSNVTSNLGVATATFFTSILSSGVHSITAAYQGDTNFKAATSSAVSVAIEGYSITPNVTSLTLTRGQSAGVIYTLASGGGLNAKVQFSCAPPPSTQMTCGFNPSALTGSGQTVLTITTTAAGTAKRGNPQPVWPMRTGAVLACVLLVCGSFGRRAGLLLSRARIGLLVGVLAVASMTGCGNSISKNPNNPSPSLGTPLGVQVLTITTSTTVNGTTTTLRSYLSVDVQ